MNLVRVLLAGAFVLGLTPGGVETMEDVGHLVLLGHLEEGDCEDACDANGCTPGSHACSCCASAHVVVADSGVDVPAPGARPVTRLRALDGGPRAGFARIVPRPPAA